MAALQSHFNSLLRTALSHQQSLLLCYFYVFFKVCEYLQLRLSAGFCEWAHLHSLHSLIPAFCFLSFNQLFECMRGCSIAAQFLKMPLGRDLVEGFIEILVILVTPSFFYVLSGSEKDLGSIAFW